MKDYMQDTADLDLEDILKEFSDTEDSVDAVDADEFPDIADFSDDGLEEEAEPAEAEQEEAPAEEPSAEEPPVEEPEETATENAGVTSDTIRLDNLSQIEEQTTPQETDVTTDTIRLELPVEEEPTEEAKEEPKPAAPIVFDPKAKLREMKRKLVAGPERRYYELAELGVGKLQMGMFLCLVVIAGSAGSAVMYAMDMVPDNRMRLMVFGQVLAMLVGALLGSHQMIDGVNALLKGKFTPNTLLAITFLACCADSVFCLQELRVPICAAFTLEVMMSLWGTYHKRVTEMGMTDTMRKAVRLISVVKYPDFYEGRSAVLRGEGQVEDFMDHYEQISRPEKIQNIYALIALLASIVVAVVAGLLHGISLGVQILSTTLLVAVPASFFITLTRPFAVLERRLHEVGTVLCGWKGVVGLSGKCLYPLSDQDMFPTGAVKMNGVKFYGDRAPETIIAYAAALMRANGGSLAPIFDQLLASRNGVRFTAENLQFYGNGGIGGEINGDPVLMGTLEFLKEMGVEIPDGTMVKQAVYVSVDGDLSGLFAITYSRVRHAVAGMATLSSSRRIRPVIIARDFLLTDSFLKETFGLRPKRTAFPNRTESLALERKLTAVEGEALALTTRDGLSSVAYAITGARALNTASRLGLVVHMIGGVLGLVIMAALAVLGATELLTPLHILLYQLVWMIPGFIVTMWTRAI